MGTYETQIGLHTISNWGQNTEHVSESGKLLGTLQAWLVRNGVANLLSLPESERLGFRITYVTLEEWVVTSRRGMGALFSKGTPEGARGSLLCIWAMLRRKLSLRCVRGATQRGD